MRENENFGSLAIVQMSATFEGAEYQVRALEGGADTFLADPIEPAVLVATVRAMLRLRRAESQLREYDRRKDEFLATVAHELRNPLAPLRHCLELLERSNDVDADLHMCLPIMTRQADHLVRLVDDLADMSRITQNKLTLRLARIDVLESLQSAIEEHRVELEGKGQTLELKVPDHPVMLLGDAVRLSQVFANLLSNAARYTPRNGTITVLVTESPEAATVTFIDNGEGIEPDDLRRIFDLFVQVAQHRSGLGIGLALVQRIVRMHGGTVAASSGGRGAGSTFTVHLPLTGQRSIGPQEAGRASAQFRETLPAKNAAPIRRRVLLADDNVDAADSLARVLIAMGHEVRVVYSGEEAVATYATFHPDVVLMDINMPDMDGFRAIERIREGAGGRRAVICTLSGHGNTHAPRAFAAGADGHLVKPIGQTELRAVLDRV